MTLIEQFRAARRVSTPLLGLTSATDDETQAQLWDRAHQPWALHAKPRQQAVEDAP